MTAPLDVCNVVIVIFAMDGCHHCHEYLPRFERELGRFQALGWPFVIFDGRRAPSAGEIPVVIVDGASMDPSVDALAQKYAVEGMPTTLVMPRHGAVMKLEGAIDNAEIYEALKHACRLRGT